MDETFQYKNTQKMTSLDRWLNNKNPLKESVQAPIKNQAPIKKRKRKVDISDYIDDEVESGGYVEEDNELRVVDDDNDKDPKEFVKKRTKKQIRAEREEEEKIADCYETDEEAEREAEDDDETRDRLQSLVAAQREKEWEEVEKFLEDEEAEKKERDVYEQNMVAIQKAKSLRDQKAKTLETKKSIVNSTKATQQVVKSTETQKVVKLPKADFQFDCVWHLGNNLFLVHLIGFDQLGTLTIEPRHAGFSEKLGTSYGMLYPFATGKDGLALQKIAPHVKWYDFWIKPLSRLPSIPGHLASFITHGREEVLSECCEAFWPIEDGQFYLVHFAFFPCIQRNSLLSTAFHVLQKDFCPSLFERRHRLLIMTPDVHIRYPWTNGDDALALLKENCADVDLTYQELKKRLKNK